MSHHIPNTHRTYHSHKSNVNNLQANTTQNVCDSSPLHQSYNVTAYIDPDQWALLGNSALPYLSKVYLAKIAVQNSYFSPKWLYKVRFCSFSPGLWPCNNNVKLWALHNIPADQCLVIFNKKQPFMMINHKITLCYSQGVIWKEGNWRLNEFNSLLWFSIQAVFISF